MNAATVIPQLPCDAAIPDAATGVFAEATPFAEVLIEWRAQIAREALIDHSINYRAFSMRPTDGALVRKSALAYTKHGSGQLLNLLLPRKPANLNNVLRWIKPAQRAAVFNVDIRDASDRNPDDLVVLRTFVISVHGIPVRAIRAAVSTRHSLKAMDDLALAGALEQEIKPTALATVSRGVDITHGFAIVGDAHPHLTRTIHWRNSETGIASMTFGAGAMITVVDAPARLLASSEVDPDMNLTVQVAGDQSASKVRHTSPGGNDVAPRRLRISPPTACARRFGRRWLAVRSWPAHGKRRSPASILNWVNSRLAASWTWAKDSQTQPGRS